MGGDHGHYFDEIGSPAPPRGGRAGALFLNPVLDVHRLRYRRRLVEIGLKVKK